KGGGIFATLPLFPVHPAALLLPAVHPSFRRKSFSSASYRLCCEVIRMKHALSLSLLALLLLGGCATRPINPPVTQTDPRGGYRFETRQAEVKNKSNLVILAFSGGG